MALVPIALTCGNGTRFTDTSGGCNSFAYAPIQPADIPKFQGPKFSIFYRAKLHAGAPAVGGARVGVGDINAVGKRFYTHLNLTAGRFHFIGLIDTDACGFQIVFDYDIASDANEHSMAWTYDTGNVWSAYWDGVAVLSGAPTCLDLSAPTSPDDVFLMCGTTQFVGTEMFDLDRVMYSNQVVPSTQIALIHGDCGQF